MHYANTVPLKAVDTWSDRVSAYWDRATTNAHTETVNGVARETRSLRYLAGSAFTQSEGLRSASDEDSCDFLTEGSSP